MTDLPQGQGHRVLIAGAGQAALSCAAKLRSLGFAGPIKIIGEEPVLPYQRPPLSKKYLTGEMDRDRLLLKPQEWYSAQSVDVLSGIRVASISREQKTVELSNGLSEQYDTLVLATGSRARMLPPSVTHGLRGICNVRTLEDVDALRTSLAAVRRAVIVGGGYIGLEAASVFVKLGIEVTVVEAGSRVLERVASAETAKIITAMHESHGVKIIAKTSVATFSGIGGRVSSVELTDGSTVPCELAVIGIGVAVNSELAQSAGLAVGNGIRVDEYCRTNDDSILAVGDCAAFPYRGRSIRLESVPHAIAHAETAAMTIAGQAEPYVARPWFWSDQYDAKLQIAGLNAGYDRTVLRSVPGGEQSVWYFCGDRLLAVDAINAAAAYVTGRRLIEAGLTVNAAIINDLTLPYKSWVATPAETQGSGSP